MEKYDSHMNGTILFSFSDHLHQLMRVITGNKDDYLGIIVDGNALIMEIKSGTIPGWWKDDKDLNKLLLSLDKYKLSKELPSKVIIPHELSGRTVKRMFGQMEPISLELPSSFEEYTSNQVKMKWNFKTWFLDLFNIFLDTFNQDLRFREHIMDKWIINRNDRTIDNGNSGAIDNNIPVGSRIINYQTPISKLKEMFSKSELEELLQIVEEVVAEHPEFRYEILRYSLFRSLNG